MRGYLSGLAMSAATLALAAPAAAETLQGALAKAYQNNPTLTAARANQRATDENVPIQRAAGLPSASLNATYNENVLIPPGQFVNTLRTLNSNAQLQVPIYNGGSVKNGIRAADRRVQAGAEQLRGVESSVFSQVVAAYNDVLRDEAVAELNRANVRQLEVNLQATRDRFEVGDLTRTDVAQSEARLSLARGDLRTAEANLIGSRERYIQLVGEVPLDLAAPPQLPNLPDSPEQAVTVALRENPDLAAAARTREAAKFDVAVAQASRRPTLSAFGQAQRNDNFGSVQANIPIDIPNQQTSAALGLQANIPIFQGGRPSAQVRQAQARQSQAIEQVIETERNVVQQARAAFASWRAAQDVIRAAQTAVDANTLSLEGVRAENSVGNRTIIEVLNAEQELLNARVQLVTARRNAYVAAFSLLAAMGQAEARDLNLEGVVLYDPAVNYERVRDRIWDFEAPADPTAQTTRTVDTPAQNPETTRAPQ